MTPNELIERAAEELWTESDGWGVWDRTDDTIKDEYRSLAGIVIHIALEAAIAEAEKRGAVTTADAIRALLPQEDGE